MEFLKNEFETDDGTLKRTGIRWGVLKYFCEFLCNIRLDVAYHPDLEVVRSIIETGLHKMYANALTINYVNDLLDQIQIKIFVKVKNFPYWKALSTLHYWEELLTKAKISTLTRKEAVKVPFMETLIRKYEFLNYCIPNQFTDKVELTARANDKYQPIG